MVARAVLNTAASTVERGIALSCVIEGEAIDGQTRQDWSPKCENEILHSLVTAVRRKMLSHCKGPPVSE